MGNSSYSTGFGQVSDYEVLGLLGKGSHVVPCSLLGFAGFLFMRGSALNPNPNPKPGIPP